MGNAFEEIIAMVDTGVRGQMVQKRTEMENCTLQKQSDTLLVLENSALNDNVFNERYCFPCARIRGTTHKSFFSCNVDFVLNADVSFG